MQEIPPFIAYRMDGTSQASSLAFEDSVAGAGDKRPEAATDPSATGFTWVHLQRDDPRTLQWLAASGLDPFVHDALMADETRPRCTFHGDGAIVNLRGVNLNPGARPDDMVSIRFWVEADQVVSVWIRPLRAVADQFEAIARQHAPISPGDLLAKLAIRLADRAEPTVGDLADRIDALEDAILDQGADFSRGEHAAVRRSAITLRRFMGPQRDALRALEFEELDWMRDKDRSRLREATERLTRFGEELDALRDRSKVMHDQIADARAELLNRNMMVLSAVTAIFLPLGLITGLLGINVGGIPGANNSAAFLIVSALLLLLALGQLVLFRRFGILR